MSQVGKFIIVFKEHVDQAKLDEYAKHVDETGGKVTQTYGKVLNGFAAELPLNFLDSFQSFAGNDIDYIEPDSIVTTQT